MNAELLLQVKGKDLRGRVVVPAVFLPCERGPDEKHGQLVDVQSERAQVESVEETEVFQAFSGPMDAEAFGIGDATCGPSSANEGFGRGLG